MSSAPPRYALAQDERYFTDLLGFRPERLQSMRIVWAEDCPTMLTVRNSFWLDEVGQSLFAIVNCPSRHGRKVAAAGSGVVECVGLRTPPVTVSVGDQVVREVSSACLEFPQGRPGCIAVLDQQFDRSKKLADHRRDHRSVVPVSFCEHPRQLHQHRNADISG